MADQPTLIASVRRALHLLDAVGASDRPLTAKALARATSEPLPTTYHLLRTLVHEGYLRRFEGGYALGERVSALGARLQHRPLRERVHPMLSGLHDTLRAAAYLAVYEDGEIRLVDVVDSPAAPRVDLWVDLAVSGHATALGKAVLAALDDEGRRDYLSRHELADLTPYTQTDRRALLRGITDGADVVLDRQEYSLGIACVATPVRTVGAGGTVAVGAVAVSVAAARLNGTLGRSPDLTRAAERIALEMAH
ncbi:MAG: IclR family transcriptional regulator C-terminal domain-containing protein [Kineosporiaceae bacterium]